jgi:hypothetical protein
LSVIGESRTMSRMVYSVRQDTSRRVIDVAIGILVGLRGCSDREAFDELVSVVNQTGIGIARLAAGLVALASGSSLADDAEVFTVWGELIERGRAMAATR